MINNLIKCTGCGACLNACPVSAITMEEKNGYSYPVINKTLCTGCDYCSKVCMIGKELSDHKDQTKFEFRMDGQDIINSSSGGFCFTISKLFIEKLKGVVYAAVYDSNEKIVLHQRIDSVDLLNKSRGSKYVKSNHFIVFKDIKENLKNNKKVLFIGLPCECRGLMNYLGNNSNNLYTVSLLCGGAVSNRFFKKYLLELEKKYKQEIESVNFRNKKYGSDILCTSITLKNKKVIILPNGHDYYISLEGSRFVRPSCHECGFTPEHITSDFVVGDCFGGAKRNDGLSVIITNNSARPLELLESLNIKLAQNNKLIVSSRAINNAKGIHNISSEDVDYSGFYSTASIDLKKAVHKYIYKRYTTKQKIYRLLPVALKAKLKK